MVLTGIVFLFAPKDFAFLVSFTLFISAAYLYRLRHNYDEKSQIELEEDKKSWFITLVAIFILMFLYFDGLHYVLQPVL